MRFWLNCSKLVVMNFLANINSSVNLFTRSETHDNPIQKLDLYVIGTNLSTGFAEVFSAERHPDMELATAILISMLIPFFFAAVRHGDRQDVYVDGGFQLNYPIKLFDRERYIDLEKDPDAARRTGYYNKENARFQLLIFPMQPSRR
ncbi:MAG: hypothetical protein EA373_13470 [Oceanospirillales bacterium]|nr:MAG: hypothetical protein EA373_13470 [Oceanospirillales bacterium]